MNAPKPKLRWLQETVSPKQLVILFLVGILQYWVIGLLCVYGFISDPPRRVDWVMYLVHYSSVGGLIGFALSKNGLRGSLIGAIIGLVLAAGLVL